VAAAVCFASLPYDCKVCSRDEEQARTWGCLGPVPEPVERWACFACVRAGPANDHDPNCPVCHGTGEWGVCECPRKLARFDSLRVCQAFMWMEHAGVAPADGGLFALPAKTLAALHVVAAEYGKYYEERMKAEAAKAKAAAGAGRG